MGRMGRAAGQDEWHIQIKIDPTQVRDLLCHPVQGIPVTLMSVIVTHKNLPVAILFIPDLCVIKQLASGFSYKIMHVNTVLDKENGRE